MGGHEQWFNMLPRNNNEGNLCSGMNYLEIGGASCVNYPAIENAKNIETQHVRKEEANLLEFTRENSVDDMDCGFGYLPQLKYENERSNGMNRGYQECHDQQKMEEVRIQKVLLESNPEEVLLKNSPEKVLSKSSPEKMLSSEEQKVLLSKPQAFTNVDNPSTPQWMPFNYYMAHPPMMPIQPQSSPNQMPPFVYYPVAVNQPAIEQNKSFSISELESMIEKFNGEGNDLQYWIKTIEHWKQVYGWSSLNTLKYACSRLTGAAKNWYNSNLLQIRNYEEFKYFIEREFPDTCVEAEIHAKLRAMIKLKEETYTEFAYRVQRLARMVNLHEQSTLIYIISGLSNDTVYNDVRCGRYETVKQLTDHIKQITIHQSHFKRNTHAIVKPRLTVSAPSNEKEKNILPSPDTHKTRRVCFKCRSPDHLLKSCPEMQNQGKVTGLTRTVHAISDEDQEASKNSSKVHSITVDDEGMIESYFYHDGIKIIMNCLVDTGSPFSLIRKSTLPNQKKVSLTNRTCSGLNSSDIEVFGLYNTEMYINSWLSSVEFLVVADSTMSVDAILGRDYIRRNLVEQVHFKRLCFDSGNKATLEKNICENSFDELLAMIQEENLLDIGDDKLTCSKIKEVEKIFNEFYRDYVRPDEPLNVHTIEVKFKKFEDYHVNPQRFSVYEKQELNKMIKELLDSGVIKESESPHTSRVVLTKKKNGSLRLCVDFRKLNKMVIRDHFPIPLIEDQILKLRNKKYFSSLDMKSGFHHVRVHEDSTKYFAFVTDEGVYEYVRMPFGFCNAPEAFVRYVHKILRELIESGDVIAFFDDIMVATDNIEKHLEVLKKLFKTLSDNHISLNLSKCSILKTRIVYLGYEVSENSIQPSDYHIRSIKDISPPTNADQLHRFLGLVGYFRKFVKGFSTIAEPLYNLLKKEVLYEFGEKQLEAFRKLKSTLLTKPVLTIFSPSSETQLHTDASASGLGGILLQKSKEDNHFHPVMYFSRRTSEAESKLHSFELETLAIVHSLQRFKPYLSGMHFKIVTDCKALQLTLNKRDMNPKIGRWALFIDQFDFEMAHRPGDKMRHVDALSRLYVHAVHEEYPKSTLFEESLYVAQLGDNSIEKLKKEIAKKGDSEFCVEDNLVYKKSEKGLLLYIPSEMEQSVINHYHDSGGHFGRDKVFHAIKKQFWFPEMKTKIQKHISSCIVCLSYNPKPFKYDGYLNLVEKPTVPFQVIHVDHLGPLERTKGKNVHIFAICDAFTKHIKLYPTKTTATSEVMKCLKSYFMTYSTPKVLISDRGTAFTSKAFKQFSETHCFQHVLIATACPQSNGQMERYNKTLVPLLAKLTEENGGEWDIWVNESEYLLNNSYNKAINTTPAEVLFGVKQCRPIDNRLFTYVQEIEQKIERDLKTEREKVHKYNLRSQVYNQSYRNKHCKVNTKYQEGDYVLIRAVPTVGENNKLKCKFKGPYVVAKVLDYNRYFLTDIEGYQCSNRRFTGIFDPVNMKLYPHSTLPKEIDFYDENYLEIDSDEEDFVGFEKDKIKQVDKDSYFNVYK